MDRTGAAEKTALARGGPAVDTFVVIVVNRLDVGNCFVSGVVAVQDEVLDHKQAGEEPGGESHAELGRIADHGVNVVSVDGEEHELEDEESGTGKIERHVDGRVAGGGFTAPVHVRLRGVFHQANPWRR